MMYLYFDNNLGSIVQLCQNVYTGIKILRRVGHGRQDMNIASSKMVTFLAGRVQHIANKLTSDFWIAKNLLSNQIVGRANARMT